MAAEAAELLPITRRVEGSRLLLIDEEVATRKALCQQLRALDCHCRPTHSAAGALSEIALAETQGVRYDIALVATSLEEALLLASEVRRRHDQPPRLVMVTAAGHRGDGIALRRAGFRGYLMRPLSDTQLRAHLVWQCDCG